MEDKIQETKEAINLLQDEIEQTRKIIDFLNKEYVYNPSQQPNKNFICNTQDSINKQEQQILENKKTIQQLTLEIDKLNAELEKKSVSDSQDKQNNNFHPKPF